MDTLTITLIAAIAGAPAGIMATLTPIILARMASRERHLIRSEDRAERELVARRVAEATAASARAAGIAQQSQEDTARRLMASNAKLASDTETAALIGEKTLRTVQVVHTLVNSDLTKALRGQLEATEAQLALMRQIVEGRESPDEERTKLAMSIIHKLEIRITELKHTLTTRSRDAEAAEEMQNYAVRDGIGRL